MVTRVALTAFFAAGTAASAAAAQGPAARDSVPAISEVHLFSAFAALAADSMEGRKAGTPGGARARRYLLSTLTRIGVEPLVPQFTAPFSGESRIPERRDEAAPVVPDRRGSARLPRTPEPVRLRYRYVDGVNVLAVVRGTLHPSRYIVVSAHYDHLGVIRGRIYNGADDNASGSAALVAIAEWTVAHPPLNSVIFAWFDGEEDGLLGSSAFVARPPVPLDSIVADVNVDMVSHSANHELFAAGANRWPVMKPLVDTLAALGIVTLRQGHDVDGNDDWTQRSDMGPFHEHHIPFVHFGVEEDADYHQPTDRVDRIQPVFYFQSVVAVAEFVRRLDAAADLVAIARRRR